ncbi:hypothetical protein [Paraburkholderia caballeronis]|uniref:Uncharacterized protein n=1 Tax=Paraburkholderia caballeronis TaxID=416943 RepID=A0A1H7GXL8_9BURK|nr:hypothetical protein [Paraburkholderia caballeronis]PXW29729.1 hypothetical protein C7403_101585 [Paraburkholderia caballeronis]PXX04988.1 hypothetical protein C7407_101585 [Paraburkholderia caballeronis]RAK06049.1 hypothetical protein C7409_101585 [Paraburkholderia caballeronis]TDV11005.1 hypothetical protein C7408_11318 [Paraburkholderia caballeronis]TDV14305.1 hypothetical protein C7406_114140 [Paraburkholderia caballeronis]
MEKMVVIAGIWTMCALCAVLFIRGATGPAQRRLPAGHQARDEELSVTQRAE